MSSRNNQQCPLCLKKNIKDMVRHLSWCSYKEADESSKKQKQSSVSAGFSADDEDYSSAQTNAERTNTDVQSFHNCGISFSSNDNSSIESLFMSEELTHRNSSDEKKLSIENTINLRKENEIEDKQHKFELEILQFCNKIDAPLYAYDGFMKILQNHNETEKIFGGQINSRSSLENQIKSKFPFLKNTGPIMKVATLDDGSIVDVVTFDFLSMLTSLLNDEKCMKDDCLTFPNDDPYSFPMETGFRGEFHTGTWYQDVWKNRWKKHGDFILGIVFFIDKTFTDVYGRLNLLPVQFTITMFNQNTRTQYHARRPLGYVNDLRYVEENSDAKIATNLRSERNLRNFHSILRVIMQSLKEVQESSGVNYTMLYKGRSYLLNFIPIIGPIIGDSEEHDVLVGRYGSYNRVKRICRYCDCSFFDSDKPFYGFNYTKQEDLKEIYMNFPEEISRQKLNEISYHHINNAFYDMDFGDDDRALHGLCPAEILHCVRLGLFKMAVTCFYNLLHPRHKTELEKVVSLLKNQFKHQSDRCVPRTTFTFMISDLTKITAGEWIGIVLLLTTTLLTKAGVSIWRSTGNNDSLKNDFIKLFDRLLILDEWLRKTDKFVNEELDDIRLKLSNFLVSYKRICRRREGNEMKVLKYHLMTHVIDDIKRLGSPQNVNGGPCESNFVPQKREAKRTQRRNENFLKQMGMRMHEKLVLAHAMNNNDQEEDKIEKQGEENVPVGGSKFDVLLDSETKTPYERWKRKREGNTNYISWGYYSLCMKN